MKSSGAVGVSIIIVSFLAVALLSSVNITQIDNGKTEYQFITDDIIKAQSAYKTSEYKDYIISKEKKDDKKDIIFYNRGHFFKQKAGLTDSEITPLKTILNSFKLFKNCESITIDLNLKMENWKEWYTKYPTTPIFMYTKDDHFIPLGIPTEYKGDVNNIIFDYKPGDSVIYLKNFDKNMKYTGAGGINLQIDTLFIGHHYGTVSHSTTHQTVNLALNEPEYKFKWCEKCKIKNITDPVINIKEKYPNTQYYKINLSNFIKCGDSIRINTYDYKIENNQIYLERPYNLKDIDILYENDKCSLKFNDVNKTEDLGKIIDNKIVFSGDWGFTPKYYEGNHIENIEHKWNVNPFSIFEMNKTIIVEFIGAVIILSGICTYSIGLNFIDWVVILSIIAFILMAW